MPNHATLLSTPTQQAHNSDTGNHQSTDHDKNKYHLSKTIYAVGIDPTISPKERLLNFIQPIPALQQQQRNLNRTLPTRNSDTAVGFCGSFPECGGSSA